MTFDSRLCLKNINASRQKDYGCRPDAWHTGVSQPLSLKFWAKCVCVVTVLSVVSSTNVLNAAAPPALNLYGVDTTITESNFPISTITSGSGTPNLTINLTSSSQTLISIASPIANVTLIGSQTLTLSSTSSYTGSTTIDSGATLVGNISNSSAVTVNGTYDVSNVARTLKNVSGSGTLTNSNTGTARVLTLSSTGNTTFSGVISGSKLNISKSGTGTLTLTGANTYAGTTAVSAGTLLITGSNTGAGAASFSTGATLQIGNGGTTGSFAGNINTGAVGNSGTVVFNRSNDYTYAGTISGSGTVTKSGSATLTLSGYSGSSTINLNSGTLKTTNTSTSQGALATSTLKFNGGTLQAGANITLRGSTQLMANGTLDVNGYAVTYI